MSTMSYEDFQEKVSKLKTTKDVNNFTKELVAPILQEMLEVEMNQHLGYRKNDIQGNNSGNSRNGYLKKNFKGSFGKARINVPRDRNSSFNPLAIRKYETVDSDLEEKIISMYAKGITTRDINKHIFDIYGVEISAGMVSNITDKIMPLIEEWQNRPLDNIYPIVYLDGIHFKVRTSGRIKTVCAYTVLGINIDGKKNILGIWIGEAESAKFWLKVLSEIKERGVEDILITCIDGLRGFKDAIQTIYPKTQIQRCIIHQIRNTVKYIPHRYKKDFCNSLKAIYKASNEQSGFKAIEQVKKDWPQYEIHLKSWEDNWNELSTLFEYPAQIRKIIYTTNAVEGVHRQLRKITKTTTIFPHEESLKKLLWLGINDISKKWTMSVHNWGDIITQFAIIHPDRIKL